jgi:hypothetical protein
MKKRPLSIVIISIFYLLEPVGNLVQAAYINKVPVFGSQGILSHLIWSDWIILCLFPIVGIGIYMVRKWGWYLFLSFSALLVFYNLFVFIYLNPNYPLAVVIFFILITTAITAFFLRKNVYAPYFNPRLRWWEIAARYRVPLETTLATTKGALNCKTVDISETGCFVEHHEDLPLGSVVMLEFHCNGMEISCMGKIVSRRASERENCQGYGIMFQAIPSEMKKRIRQLIWFFEKIGLEDRKDNANAINVIKEISWQEYNLFDQIGFRVKHHLKGILGTR